MAETSALGGLWGGCDQLFITVAKALIATSLGGGFIRRWSHGNPRLP